MPATSTSPSTTRQRQSDQLRVPTSTSVDQDIAGSRTSGSRSASGDARRDRPLTCSAAGKPMLVDPEGFGRTDRQQGEIGWRRPRTGLAGRPVHSRREDPGRPRRSDVPADERLTRADQEILTFVGEHIATALERTRLIDETRQRNAELALDQRRPARSRREARHAGDVRPRRGPDPGDLRRAGRRHRDPRPEAGLIQFPYTIERGVRFPDEPIGADRASAGTCSRRASRWSSTRGRPRGSRSRAAGRRSGRAAEVVRLRAADRRRPRRPA